MKKVFGIFRQRWFVTLLGMLALGVLIWFLGPLFAFAGVEPLAEPSHRVIAILLALGLWAANLLRRRLSAAHANSQVMQGMAGAGAEPSAAEAESAAEIATLKQRMDEALALLKQARLGGRWDRRQLYQLPWYIFIGPPGSGKTTALANSGLRFPLAERFGNQAIQGVGGTRNCDWWFTDQAVLLDTAGRYTTQDSHQEVDKAAWEGFLDMLRKHRRRRPINGALVAISISDLVRQTETERETQARAIRQRIQELHEHLGIRFPVYVLFTKCDLIAGFMEFFDDLDREGRAQGWGMTFDLDEGTETGSDANEVPAEPPLASFGTEFDALEQRLDQRLVERLQQERDPRRRGLIYGFPQQYATLKEVAGQFLDAVFHPSRFEQRPLLRGVYFTSGTQEGNPIDRLMGRLGATLGLDRQDLASWSGKGRSYFLTRLFQAVIFPEAGLAGTNLRLERRRAWLQRAAYTGLAGLVVLAVAAWTTSYLRNRAYVDHMQARAAQVQQQVEALPGSQLDLLATLPLLDAARGLARLTTAEDPSDQPTTEGGHLGRNHQPCLRAEYP